MNITKIFSWVFIGIAIAFFIFFSSIVALVTDWWWFNEVGFTEIFIKSLGTKVILGVTAFLFAAAFLVTNFLVAIRSKIPRMLAIPEALIGQPLSLNDRIVKKLGIGVCLAVSFFIGLVAAAGWLEPQEYTDIFSKTPSLRPAIPVWLPREDSDLQPTG